MNEGLAEGNRGQEASKAGYLGILALKGSLERVPLREEGKQ
jgi:hypothetical protein